MARPARKDSEKSSARAVGALIREGRRKQKLSQRALAEKLPMSQAHLSRLELGEHTPPPDDVLLKVAKELALDPRELLRAAGRQAAGETFEQLVLDRLDTLTRALEELRQAVARVEQATERQAQSSGP